MQSHQFEGERVEQLPQPWVGASTLLADLCGHGDTLTSPRVSPLMWMKPQSTTTTLPDNPSFPYGKKFLSRDAMLARCMLLSCVRVSLSHAGIVSKRLNV